MRFGVDFMDVIRTYGTLPHESIEQYNIVDAQMEQSLNELRHEAKQETKQLEREGQINITRKISDFKTELLQLCQEAKDEIAQLRMRSQIQDTSADETPSQHYQQLLRKNQEQKNTIRQLQETYIRELKKGQAKEQEEYA